MRESAPLILPAPVGIARRPVSAAAHDTARTPASWPIMDPR